jgi:hypothetical protein
MKTRVIDIPSVLGTQTILMLVWAPKKTSQRLTAQSAASRVGVLKSASKPYLRRKSTICPPKNSLLTVFLTKCRKETPELPNALDGCHG